MFNVAVLGYGTVGSGVVKVINDNNQVLKKFSGEEINVKYVLDLRDFPGDPVEKILVHDYEAILADDDVKCVVEVMGGVEPANKFVRQAIEKGKSVCTSNKELVARYDAERKVTRSIIIDLSNGETTEKPDVVYTDIIKIK